MKLRYSCTLVVSLIIGSICSGAQERSSFIIAACQAPLSVHWSLYSKDGFVVSDPTHDGVTKKISRTTMVITVNEQGIVVNGSNTKRKKLHIQPINGSTLIDQKVYEGDLEIILADNQIELVACTMPLTHEVDQKSERMPSLKTETAMPHYSVRVLLDEKLSREKPHWRFNVATGCTYINPADRTHSWLSDESSIDLVIRDRTIYINGTRYSGSQVVLVPHDGLIHFNDNCYQGSFLITCQEGVTYVINALDLEDYVFSVLRTESWPGWPLEVNKVFAIACRSYAIAMIVRSKKNKLPYHIKNTNVHQTYTGIHESPLLKSAVEETKGIFLAYRGKPIIAMFDACCGGVVPALIKDFNFTDAPYLARSYPCTYCKTCKIYNWQANYSVHTLSRLLDKRLSSVKKVKEVNVTSKDKAGLVKEVMIKGTRDTVRVPGKKIYSKLKDVKSFCFLVEKHGDDIVFTGRGYGHHLGLCQWGAREMIRQGNGTVDHRRVLQFYYPGTHFMRCAV